MSLLASDLSKDPNMNNGYPGQEDNRYPNNYHQQIDGNLTQMQNAFPQPISPFPTPSPSPPSQPFSPREDYSHVSQIVASQVPEKDRKWFFESEQIRNSPSRKLAGLSSNREADYRRQAARLMQDIGISLQVTQLCINSAIVYFQRFYMFHSFPPKTKESYYSFAHFHRNAMAPAAMLLATKVEEQPRKAKHVLEATRRLLEPKNPPLDDNSPAYKKRAEEMINNENLLLQTLGFDVTVEHPHAHVVYACKLVKASQELAQAAYYIATQTLHLTTMCLIYPPKLVACVCIHMACRLSNYKIPLSQERKEWFIHVLEPNWLLDSDRTFDLLEKLTNEFLGLHASFPSKLKNMVAASNRKVENSEQNRMVTSPPQVNQGQNQIIGNSMGQQSTSSRNAMPYLAAQSMPIVDDRSQDAERETKKARYSNAAVPQSNLYTIPKKSIFDL